MFRGLHVIFTIFLYAKWSKEEEENNWKIYLKKYLKKNKDNLYISNAILLDIKSLLKPCNFY